MLPILPPQPPSASHYLFALLCVSVIGAGWQLSSSAARCQHQRAEAPVAPSPRAATTRHLTLTTATPLPTRPHRSGEAPPRLAQYAIRSDRPIADIALDVALLQHARQQRLIRPRRGCHAARMKRAAVPPGVARQDLQASSATHIVIMAHP